MSSVLAWEGMNMRLAYCQLCFRCFVLPFGRRCARPFVDVVRYLCKCLCTHARTCFPFSVVLSLEFHVITSTTVCCWCDWVILNVRSNMQMDKLFSSESGLVSLSTLTTLYKACKNKLSLRISATSPRIFLSVSLASHVPFFVRDSLAFYMGFS